MHGDAQPHQHWAKDGNWIVKTRRFGICLGTTENKRCWDAPYKKTIIIDLAAEVMSDLILELERQLRISVFLACAK